MFVSTDPRRLIDAVLELVEVAGVNDLPQLRVGVATGLAVSRAGDWFGSPVNVANRVAGLAKPGTVLGHRTCTAIDRRISRFELDADRRARIARGFGSSRALSR